MDARDKDAIAIQEVLNTQPAPIEGRRIRFRDENDIIWEVDENGWHQVGILEREPDPED